MKRLFIFVMSVVALAACKPTGNQLSDGTSFTPGAGVDFANEVFDEVKYNPHSFLMTQEKLPKSLDLNMDISDMTMQELQILRNYPYAMKGMWFMDFELNNFFCMKTDWYYDLCVDLGEKNNYQAFCDYNQFTLNKAETDFVNRVDERIKELKKDDTITRDGLKLSNPVMAVNMFETDTCVQDLVNRLGKYNFAIAPTKYQQLFNVYEQNEYRDIPNYVTTDLFLQAYHMYFSYILKYLEQHKFMESIHSLNVAMHNEAMKLAASTSDKKVKDLAEFNAAYFAVAEKLLTGEDLAVPSSYAAAVQTELDNVKAEEFRPSAMMLNKNWFHYGLFKPRGHYTRNEKSEHYFRTMMWLQSFLFARENKNSVMQTVVMAYLFNHIDRKVASDGMGVYKTLDYLMGQPDNVAVIDIADYLSNNMNVPVEQLGDKSNMKKIDKYLVSLFKTRNRIKSKKVEKGFEDHINFMPQRYMPDSYVLSRMYDETLNAPVAFPRGIDVFGAFGTQLADDIISGTYHDPDNWKGYAKEMGALKKEFGNFPDWDKSMYNKWMESLVTLQKTEKNYPDYMKTTGWGRKNLNSALASWAELRHDAILYAKQPMCAEAGDGEFLPEPKMLGYVEPNLVFWNKLKEMLGHTNTLLNENNLMTEDIKERSSVLGEYVDLCISASQKEINGDTLSSEEYNQIKYIGGYIERFTLSVLDPDKDLYEWRAVSGPDRSIAVVADVFTRSLNRCSKNGILFEATGNADEMYVLVNIGGKVYLTRGAVFSYYEFINSVDAPRLTDEEWQQQLKDGKEPERPVWMKSLYMEHSPIITEYEYQYEDADDYEESNDEPVG